MTPVITLAIAAGAAASLVLYVLLARFLLTATRAAQRYLDGHPAPRDPGRDARAARERGTNIFGGPLP